jgi:hypothetical protein
MHASNDFPIKGLAQLPVGFKSARNTKPPWINGVKFTTLLRFSHTASALRELLLRTTRRSGTRRLQGLV